MIILIALIISIVFQFVAIYYALKLIKLTNWLLSWILISAALLFMAVRRFIEIIHYFSHDEILNKIDLLNCWIGVITSLLIAVGVILIRKIFFSLKEVEKARFESEKKFKILFNSSSDEIFVIDFDGKIIEVNQVACDTLGYRKDEFNNMYFRNIKPNQYAKLVCKKIKEIKESSVEIFESELLTKDEKIIPVEIKDRIIDYNGGKAILCIARDITERKQIERKILNAIIETEEKNKERFAKDLHDGLGTLLSSINIYISLMKTGKISQDETNEILDYTKGLIDEAILNTKEITNNLRPNIINSFGLTTSVKSFCDKINDTGLIKISFNSNIENNILDKDIEVALFRIINELINNTLKHASANNVSIELLFAKRLLSLIYKDDGIGFDVESVINEKVPKGMGLSNVMSRVKAVDGKCEITSAKDKGIQVKINIKL